MYGLVTDAKLCPIIVYEAGPAGTALWVMFTYEAKGLGIAGMCSDVL